MIFFKLNRAPDLIVGAERERHCIVFERLAEAVNGGSFLRCEGKNNLTDRQTDDLISSPAWNLEFVCDSNPCSTLNRRDSHFFQPPRGWCDLMRPRTDEICPPMGPADKSQHYFVSILLSFERSFSF